MQPLVDGTASGFLSSFSSLKRYAFSMVEHASMTLHAKAGQPLVIELSAMPGAGILWQLPSVPAGCTLTEGDLVQESGGIGGSARQRFILTCAQPGRYALRFELKRPWESEVRELQSVTVTVS